MPRRSATPARTWAAGAVALLVAAERFAAGRAIDPAVMGGALSLLGPAAHRAATLDELASGLPAQAPARRGPGWSSRPTAT